MNTIDSLEEKILQEIRNLPPNLRSKLVTMVQNLRQEAIGTPDSMVYKWSEIDESFFESLQKRAFHVDQAVVVEELTRDINDGLS